MSVQDFSVDSIMEIVRASGSFGTSKRRYALLEYLLTEQYAGRGERIKAYAIALDVFGRDDDFDTSIDSIVRVEMHRLRRALKQSNDGADRFTLTIPASSYEAVRTPIVQQNSTWSNHMLLWLGIGLTLLGVA